VCCIYNVFVDILFSLIFVFTSADIFPHQPPNVPTHQQQPIKHTHARTQRTAPRQTKLKQSEATTSNSNSKSNSNSNSNMSAITAAKTASTPPTYRKKRKKLYALNTLCSSVKRAMVDAIERERKGEEDQKFFKRFKRDAASPQPMPLTEEKENTLRDNIITSWEKDDVQSVLAELNTLHFKATQDMVHDTLKTDATEGWSLDNVEHVQRKVVDVLKMIKVEVEHTRRLRMESADSSPMGYQRRMQYLYKSLVLNVSRLKEAEKVG
jgi:hypothetical protein